MGGGSRVSKSADLLKTIREMTGKQHSDEDILEVLKDCHNDPQETAHKLMYLDTFQEVKSKRGRKAETQVSRTQERGWYGRRNFGANNGRTGGFRRQTGANHTTGGSGTVLSASNKEINKTQAPAPKSPSSVVGNHKTQDGSISPVNKGVTEEQSLSKSTSSTENGFSLEKSKASVVTVAVPVSDSNSSGQSVQVTKTEAAASKGNNQSLLQSDIGERPHVIFPAYLQAAKVLENGLSFGSFTSEVVKEASSDSCTNGCNDSNLESSHRTVADEASLDNCTNGCNDPNLESSHGTMADLASLDSCTNGCNESNLESSNGTVADVASAREEISQDKEEEMLNLAPNAELALQLDETVHPVEGPVGDKSSITDSPQAANLGGAPISYPDQGSIAASQQAMHLYPPHIFPYGPYFSPYCMPPQQFMHPYMNPNGFQQPYLPPGDNAPTPPGLGPPLPLIKSGSNAEPTAIPSPYGSYTVAFNNTINSANKEGKGENICTNGPMSLANLHANNMYNFSRLGQPLAFPTMQPGFNGMYQQAQPIQPAPIISGVIEPIGPPYVPSQLPQAALADLGNNYFVKQSN